MYTNLNNLIKILLIKKNIKCGKQTKALKINKNICLLNLKDNFLNKVILTLVLPIKLEQRKIGSVTYKLPKLIHYYKSINIAISWLIKASKLKARNKMPIYKAIFLESLNVLNLNGYAYFNLKQHTIKKALISRVFLNTLSKK